MADQPIDAAPKAALALAIALAVTATLIGDGTVAWVVGIAVLGLLVFTMNSVPLRHSLLGLMFASLTLENPSEAPAAGMWQSPLYRLGALMLNHMNQTTGVSWMSISGCDLLLIVLILIAWHRSITHSKMDGAGNVASPKELVKLAYLSLAGSVFVWVWGVIIKGGDMQKSLWQMEKVTYLPIIFLLFRAALRGPQDYVMVGRVLLYAAITRALLAIYVMHFAELDGEPPWATTHHDSMLFACAMVIIVSLVMHRARRDLLKWWILIVPLLVWGMIENNRRTVWVQIGLVFVVLYFSTPPSPAKKKIKKFLLITSPIWIAYIVIGWGSASGIFKPVANIKSVVTPANDLSTMTRDIENYCIARTIGFAPIFGLGYGHAFFQLVTLPPMPHPLEPWLPHNSLLGLWFAAGFVGYTSMTLLWAAGVYFGVRAYRFAKRAMDRSVALVCFGSVLIYLIQCYADLGLGAMTGVYMVAASIAISGQMAIATGAFPADEVKRPAQGPPRAPAADGPAADAPSV